MDYSQILTHVATAERAGGDKKALVLALMDLDPQEEQAASIVIDALVWAANNQQSIQLVTGKVSRCCYAPKK